MHRSKKNIERSKGRKRYQKLGFSPKKGTIPFSVPQPASQLNSHIVVSGWAARQKNRREITPRNQLMSSRFRFVRSLFYRHTKILALLTSEQLILKNNNRIDLILGIVNIIITGLFDFNHNSLNRFILSCNQHN